MFKISVITVVLNDAKALEQTIRSVAEQRKYFPHLEYIVVDGGSTDGSLAVAEKYNTEISVFVSAPDRGLYDAMNKGLDLSTGDGILFVNAGDRLNGNVLGGVGSAPLFFPVQYKNVLGFTRKVRIQSIRYGLPNCHQGILFEKSRLRYDLTYSVSSDYDYFIRHGYDSSVTLHEAGGYVTFSPGISSAKYKMRDKELFVIKQKHFGCIIALLWEWRSFGKRQIRWLLSFR
jgi:putative colanic acid biosynthesis glycosyltransferase